MEIKKPMLGLKFGSLLVIEDKGKNKFGGFCYLCKCSCGNEKVISGSHLRSGSTTSCGCIGLSKLKYQREHSVENLSGLKFGRLLVIERIKDGLANTRWNCICDCGNKTVAITGNLKNGKHKSCGCYRGGETAHNKKEITLCNGYAFVKDFSHPRANKHTGRVRQHIVVMERMLGRYLLKGEEVHHKNGVRDDNREENLELWVKSQPAGQRPADLVDWANEILKRYSNEPK